jgi:hypothetical protein
MPWIPNPRISLIHPTSPIPLHPNKLNLIFLPLATLHRRLRRLRNARPHLESPKTDTRLGSLACPIRRFVRIVTVLLVFFRTGLCGLETAGEDVGEEAAQRWHADAEDADEGFEDGPVCGGDVVVGGVCGSGELDEGL